MAYDALRSLLEVKSAETRYGAFRALWAMNEHDPFLHDENLTGQFHYHVLDVPGPEMVHVTHSYLPEIVLFGKDQQFQLPLMLDAGKSILVNGMKGDKITVSRFASPAGAGTARRLDERGRSHSRDRRAGRHVPGCRSGLATGQGRRGARQPLRGRCVAAIGPGLRPRGRQRQDGRRRRPKRHRKFNRRRSRSRRRCPICSAGRGEEDVSR